MFERDVQYVLDEYLAGFITENHLIASGRAWKNYASDYRPLIEFAKEKKMPVVAANAPRRYVNRVSRLGVAALAEIEPEGGRFLPPMPYTEASADYAAKFNRFMQGASVGTPPSQQPAGSQTQANPHGGAHLLEAQTLRDASMAYSIADYLKRQRGALVVQVNGTFHSEERLGVPEQLAHYRPNARIVVVTIISDEGFPNFDVGRLGKLGDFVILTDPSLPRSSS